MRPTAYAVVVSILALIYTVFLVCALAETASVKQCYALWIVMTVRCVAAAVLFLGVCCLGKPDDSDYQIVFYGGLCIYYACFAVMEAMVVPPAMQGGCEAALSAASFTQTPLLGIIGYVLLGFDSLFALVLMLEACCLSRGAFGGTYAPVGGGQL